EPGERFAGRDGKTRERVSERERETRARCKAVVGGEPGPPRRALRDRHETDGVPAERETPNQREIAREPEAEGEGGRARGGTGRRRAVAREVGRAIASPRPVPLGFVEKNGSKRCGNASAGTPGPLSRTSSAAAPCPLATATESMRGPVASAVMASSAFSSRLISTWRSFSRSA